MKYTVEITHIRRDKNNPALIEGRWSAHDQNHDEAAYLVSPAIPFALQSEGIIEDPADVDDINLFNATGGELDSGQTNGTFICFEYARA
jgi:hypothetical protein